ncbi:hypothetical protein BU25DRAFT_417301 [Macroventuria anomochaeta]|uniref:Uncharacterized protein n=1 Tax=Macroventuria anomochaeta TaxID=301207 RepID=A0ACB6SF94_9PLEO|nr:uncharacterized protein BU25DRAFT_417301 [Macroventuria anomochaeta]KAF2632704.1 hypothetical protein BU25DRAFT_417301 [Macroventuria anomochaeta]
MTTRIHSIGSPGRRLYSTARGGNKQVGTPHFPLREMQMSVQERTGMSEITNRKCFARTTPVKLWDNRIVTWYQLQGVWAGIDPYLVNPPLFSDYGQNRTKPSKSKTKSRRYTDVPNTLEIRAIRPGELGIETIAECCVDLYAQLRFQSVDGTVATLVKQKAPCICDHLDLAKLMSRSMSENPIEFRPDNFTPAPDASVADLLCKIADKKSWTPDPSRLYRRPDRLLRKIKEQAICCGLKGDKCRTSVGLQRVRDNTAENTVGWMRDLVRLKVVRRWRTDGGTGDEEWQAQNGGVGEAW